MVKFFQMARRKYRINLANEHTVEIELEADSCQRAGENSVEFILGNQHVLCLNFRSNIQGIDDITPTEIISRPVSYERRIDLEL